MEYLKQELYDKERKFFLCRSTYCADDSLAVLCFEHVEEDNEIMDEEWCDVTVCLPYTPFQDPKTDACVDTNNSPWLAEFLQKYGIAKPTGISVHSGFCNYPIYRFDLSKLHTLNEINR